MPSVIPPSSSMSPRSGMPPVYYEETAPQWLFTSDELKQSTPSRVEGMPEDVEMLNRRKGINFITSVGIALRLDQITIATASIYFQRFYMRHPLQIGTKGAHHYQIAATSVYLAYKSKENPRKMHELIVAVSRVAQKDPNLLIDEQSKEFWKWRETIQHHENLMLEVLCFDLDPCLPYPVLFEFLKYYNVQDNKRLRNVSWAVVTDSFTTHMCLLVQPQSIAAGSLYLGLKHTGLTLPDDEFGRPWWDTLRLDPKEMEVVLETMLTTYENPQIRGSAGPEVYARDIDTMNFEHTRHVTPSVYGENTPGQQLHDRSVHSDANGSTYGGNETNGNHDEIHDEDMKSDGQSGSEEGELG
ncbi:hypothetical protein LTR05_005856 [Lithohypha guttulata]|uniref:RNA polymerase II holoenzyme cyclin-like subunit n=1 Tax=Lithohypha guttulata TaxID=1690604 RepID=A0AAN7YGE9_9EURO|nr:hypothetical protein LTR05_005856 [Lithohypha guttulata]